tara:strand:- start:565 stop:726 length:162 start_codon:yes stop_codon:yes gene_type:complete
MGRITEYIEYLNSDSDNIEKSFTHLTITDKIAQERIRLKQSRLKTEKKPIEHK